MEKTKTKVFVTGDELPDGTTSRESEEAIEQETYLEPPPDEPQFNDYSNFRHEIVAKVGYLIGVDKEQLKQVSKFDQAVIHELANNESATIIRSLGILRSQMINNYTKIRNLKRAEPLKSYETMTDLINVDCVKYLRERGMETLAVNYGDGPNEITINTGWINQYIVENVDKIRPLIPEWIKFDYIRDLLVMPNGNVGPKGNKIMNKTGQSKVYGAIKEERDKFWESRARYPFQTYINWPKPFNDHNGFLLNNDQTFLWQLYRVHDDYFQASTYVTDATQKSKNGIYDFVEKAERIEMYVDCENVNPYALTATILNLDAENINKIEKIVLFDDVNTTIAWDFFKDVVELPVEHVEVERVLDNKSLVDHKITAAVSKACYKDEIDSFVLVSSDSDFIALIQSLPDAKFFVLNERTKTANAILSEFTKNDIQHCFMDDFAQDKAQKFKTQVLISALNDEIKKFNETGNFDILDVDAFMTKLFYAADVEGGPNQIEQEKKTFFDKFIKKGLTIKPTKKIIGSGDDAVEKTVFEIERIG